MCRSRTFVRLAYFVGVIWSSSVTSLFGMSRGGFDWVRSAHPEEALQATGGSEVFTRDAIVSETRMKTLLVRPVSGVRGDEPARRRVDYGSRAPVPDGQQVDGRPDPVLDTASRVEREPSAERVGPPVLASDVTAGTAPVTSRPSSCGARLAHPRGTCPASCRSTCDALLAVRCARPLPALMIRPPSSSPPASPPTGGWPSPVVAGRAPAGCRPAPRAGGPGPRARSRAPAVGPPRHRAGGGRPRRACGGAAGLPRGLLPGRRTPRATAPGRRGERRRRRGRDGDTAAPLGL